jgi:oxalate decarboxylase
MTEVERRDLLIGTVLATAALAATEPAAAGDPSFMNNVPDPILSAAELPTFKLRSKNPKERSSATASARKPR